MKIEELLKHEWQLGYYMCGECFEVSFVDEDPNEFEITSQMGMRCGYCNGVRDHYPIVEPIFELFKRFANHAKDGGKE